MSAAPSERETWTRRLEGRLRGSAPSVADLLVDAGWTRRWRWVDVLGLPAAALLGIAGALVWPGIEFLYSESLVFLMLAIALSTLSPAFGLALTIGYAVGHLLGVSGPPPRTDFAETTLGWFLARNGGRLVAYSLLLLVTVKMPMLARRWADEVVDRPALRASDTLASSAHVTAWAVGAATLTFLWSQAAVMLLRPAFTWLGHQPTVEAIIQVQERSEWLVAAAVLAVVARASFEYGPLRSPSDVAGRPGVAEERAPRRGPRTAGNLGALAKVGAGAVSITVFLAGAYDSWLDALFTFVAVGAVGAVRYGIWRPYPRSWTRLAGRMPSVVRFVIAVVVSLVIANAIIGDIGTSFRPMLLSALLTIAIFATAFPATVPSASATGQGARSVVDPIRTLLVLTFGLLVLGGHEAAFADNCGSPGDCWNAAGAGAAAAAGAGAAAAAGAGRVRDGRRDEANYSEGVDADGDGVYEYVATKDADGKTIKETWYDRDGNPIRTRTFNEDGSYTELHDEDGDGRADRVIEHAPDGTVTSERVETDDGTWVKFDDYDGDGVANRRTTYDADGNATETREMREDGSYVIYEDTDGDGTADVKKEVAPDGTVTSVMRMNEDGTFTEYDDRDGEGSRYDHYAEYDDEGRMTEEGSDLDADGRADTVTEYEPDGSRTVYEDRDGDGRYEHTTEYDADGNVTRQTITNEDGSVTVRRDHDADGYVDVETTYDTEGNLRSRTVFEDTNRDGRVDRRTVYDADGTVTSQRYVAEDGTSTEYDDLDGDGRFDRVTRYDADGNVISRREMDDGE